MNTVPSTSLRTLVCEFQGFDDNAVDQSYKRSKNAGSPGAEYHYLYTGARNVKVGDFALVHNGQNFGMTKIVRIMPGIKDKVRKHVICVITQDDFEAYLAANKSIVNHRQVFDELDYMLEEAKKLDRYKDLAAGNPRAKELLDSLNIYNGPTLEHVEKPFQEAIPQGVVYDSTKHDFFGPGGGSMGGEFFNKWMSRAGQFPQRASPISTPEGYDIHTTYGDSVAPDDVGWKGDGPAHAGDMYGYKPGGR